MPYYNNGNVHAALNGGLNKCIKYQKEEDLTLRGEKDSVRLFGSSCPNAFKFKKGISLFFQRTKGTVHCNWNHKSYIPIYTKPNTLLSWAPFTVAGQ